MIAARRSGRLPRGRRGLTLFEVLLALAIFVGAMVAIGQLLSVGVRGALRAKLETEAVFRAESRMSEIVAGIVPMQDAADQAEPDNNEWRYSIKVEAGPNDELSVVTVTSHHPGVTPESNVSFHLSRLVRDPQVLIDAVNAEAAAEEE